MSTRTALIVVTHLLGVGHLVRAAAIARALANDGWRVSIASGGASASNVDISGCELIQLPALHCVDADFRTLLRADGGAADEVYFAARRRALIEAFDRIAPDALITELFPFGRRQLAGEFDSLLAHAVKAEKRPAILCSIRDVLHAPSKIEKAAAAEQRLGRYYDAILFHGDDAIVPLSASWPASKALLRRLRPTGYVRDKARSPSAASAASAAALASDVIVSGGGSGVGLDLYRAALAAATLTPKRSWRVLIGHGLPENDFQGLVATAPPNAIVERARPDFTALLASAELSISQAGYNTVLDLAATGARAVLVPFADGAEREQTVRATCLAERGLARIIDKCDLSGEALAHEATEAIAAPRPDWSAFQLDGAERAATIIAETTNRAVERARAWRRLRATLDDLKRAARLAPIWLRDDDAIEMTDELRAFLDRLQRWRIPVALAVIPSRLSPDFEADLAPFPEVDLLVHGWAHVNHAAAGAKASEFPVGRSVEAAERELREGLQRALRLAPRRSLPIFVPPWNRIAPTTAFDLPSFGYRGLSTFQQKRQVRMNGPFVQCDAHWDPIAWRGDGGLRDESHLLNNLSDLLAQELDADAPLDPLGMLTHHLVHDRWIDRHLDELFGTLVESGAVRFLDARAAFQA